MINFLPANSSSAKQAYNLVVQLQQHFVKQLNQLSQNFADANIMLPLSWLRDEGLHGGGVRYVATDDSLFNRGTVNISQVHYDDDPTKKLASATALSTIIHPFSPLLPSIHMHISWTEMKGGDGYWRLMADLNPAIENPKTTIEFDNRLKSAMPAYFDEACKQGDRYFNIPALNRHRGVSHFYLENFSSGDFDADKQLTFNFGMNIIDCYLGILSDALNKGIKPNKAEFKLQLDYHTLYLFQVLTLDRGTTSGLLVHGENDVGILGSIPRFVNPALLASWIGLVPKPQNNLVFNLVEILNTEVDANTVANTNTAKCVLVNDEVKQRLANAVRVHYQRYPEALKLQARGDIMPATVGNHK